MNHDLMAAVRELNGTRARALAGLATPESPEPEIATCALAVAAEELRRAAEAFAAQGWFSRHAPEPDLDCHEHGSDLLVDADVLRLHVAVHDAGAVREATRLSLMERQKARPLARGAGPRWVRELSGELGGSPGRAKVEQAEAVAALAVGAASRAAAAAPAAAARRAVAAGARRAAGVAPTAGASQ